MGAISSRDDGMDGGAPAISTRSLSMIDALEAARSNGVPRRYGGTSDRPTGAAAAAYGAINDEGLLRRHRDPAMEEDDPSTATEHPHGALGSSLAHTTVNNGPSPFVRLAPVVTLRRQGAFDVPLFTTAFYRGNLGSTRHAIASSNANSMMSLGAAGEGSGDHDSGAGLAATAPSVVSGGLPPLAPHRGIVAASDEGRHKPPSLYYGDDGCETSASSTASFSGAGNDHDAPTGREPQGGSCGADTTAAMAADGTSPPAAATSRHVRVAYVRWLLGRLTCVHPDHPMTPWLVLFGYSLLMATNGFQWINFSPVAVEAREYFHLSPLELNLLPTVYVITYVFCVPLAVTTMQTLGLKGSLAVGASLNALGAILKVVSVLFVPYFPFLIIAQAIAGIAEVFFLPLPPAVAATWFGTEHRTLATSIGAMSNSIGISIGFFAPPMMIGPGRSSMASFLAFFAMQAAVTVTVWALIVFVLPAKPTFQASMTSAREPTWSETLPAAKKLLRHWPFAVLAVASGLTNDSLWTVSSFLDQLMRPLGLSEKQSGWIGSAMTLSGVFSALAMAQFVDRRRVYKGPMLGLNVMAVTCLGLFILAMLFVPSKWTRPVAWFRDPLVSPHAPLPFLPDNSNGGQTPPSAGGSTPLFAATMTLMIAVGACLSANLPVQLEYAVELMYPSPENVVLSVFAGIARIMSPLLTVVSSEFIGGHPTPGTTVTFLTAILVIASIGTVALLFIPEDYRRKAVDQKASPAPPSSRGSSDAGDRGHRRVGRRAVRGAKKHHRKKNDDHDDGGFDNASDEEQHDTATGPSGAIPRRAAPAAIDRGSFVSTRSANNTTADSFRFYAPGGPTRLSGIDDDRWATEDLRDSRATDHEGRDLDDATADEQMVLRRGPESRRRYHGDHLDTEAPARGSDASYLSITGPRGSSSSTSLLPVWRRVVKAILQGIRGRVASSTLQRGAGARAAVSQGGDNRSRQALAGPRLLATDGGDSGMPSSSLHAQLAPPAAANYTVDDAHLGVAYDSHHFLNPQSRAMTLDGTMRPSPSATSLRSGGLAPSAFGATQVPAAAAAGPNGILYRFTGRRRSSMSSLDAEGEEDLAEAVPSFRDE